MIARSILLALSLVPAALAGSAAPARGQTAAPSAESSTSAAIARIRSVDPDALAAARALDRQRKIRGLLFGMPILIKDNIETKGSLPTTAGVWR